MNVAQMLMITASAAVFTVGCCCCSHEKPSTPFWVTRTVENTKTVVVTNSVVVPKPVVVTNMVAVPKPMVVTNTVVVHKPVVVTNAVAVPKPVVVTNTVAVSKPTVVTNTVVVPRPVVVTNTVVVSKPVVVTNTVVVSKPVVVTNVVEKTRTVEVTNTVVNTRSVTNYVDRPVTNIIVKLGDPPPPAQLPNTLALSVEGGAAGGVSGDLLAALRAELAQRGYVFEKVGAASASVTVRITTSPKASLSDWHVYEGEALVKMELGGAAPLVREKRFEVVGERALGRAQAEKAVVKPLCGAVSAWIEKIFKERK